MKRTSMDNKILKNYWLWVGLLIVVGVLVFFLKFDLPASSTERSVSHGQSFLVLDFGENNRREFQGQVASNMTILEALYSASVSGHFDFRYSIGENGVVQTAKIGNAVNLPGGTSWNFYLNGELVDAGQINNIKIKTGDSIEAKYE